MFKPREKGRSTSRAKLDLTASSIVLTDSSSAGFQMKCMAKGGLYSVVINVSPRKFCTRHCTSSYPESSGSDTPGKFWPDMHLQSSLPIVEQKRDKTSILNSNYDAHYSSLLPIFVVNKLYYYNLAKLFPLGHWVCIGPVAENS